MLIKNGHDKDIQEVTFNMLTEMNTRLLSLDKGTMNVKREVLTDNIFEAYNEVKANCAISAKSRKTILDVCEDRIKYAERKLKKLGEEAGAYAWAMFKAEIQAVQTYWTAEVDGVQDEQDECDE